MSMLSVVRMWSLASSRAQIQGKARGAEKDFIGDHLPPSKDLDDRPPPYLKDWIRQCIIYVPLFLRSHQHSPL